MYDCPEMALEPRETPAVGRCEVCGKEVLVGSMVWIDDGHMIHDDENCLKAWVETNYSILDICFGLQMHRVVAAEVA